MSETELLRLGSMVEVVEKSRREALEELRHATGEIGRLRALLKVADETLVSRPSMALLERKNVRPIELKTKNKNLRALLKQAGDGLAEWRRTPFYEDAGEWHAWRNRLAAQVDAILPAIAAELEDGQ